MWLPILWGLGATYDTGHWPHDGKFHGAMPLVGKRVAIIGTGFSGVQCIPEIAKVAKHLTVFQRTATWTVPAYNRAMDSQYASQVKANYPAVRAMMYQSGTGLQGPIGSNSRLQDCRFRDAYF